MCRLLVLLVVLAFASDGDAAAGDRQTEVRFPGNGIEIAGTILWPPRAGQVPGLVFVHGSGPGERTELLEIAHHFAAEGMAVMVYDKRGSGLSGGSRAAASLDDLAADAAAALRYLAGQPGVDPRRTGYWGISQGGWVVPLAAGMSSPAFAIVVTGGGMTPRAVETARYRAIVRHADASGDARDRAERLIAAYFDYLGGTAVHSTLQQEMDRVRDEAWFEPLGMARVVPSPQNRANWEWVASFDPAESIAQMTIPVLVLLGGRDPLTPAGDAARAWVESLPSDVPHSRVIVFQDAGHGMRTGAHGGEFVADYFTTQFDWLRSLPE